MPHVGRVAVWVSGMLILLAVGAGARSAVIDNGTVTIAANAPAFGGYAVSNVLDTGTDRLATDYASQGQGVNTFVDFDFGRTVVFASISQTDRTSSGGANGSRAHGTGEFNTGYNYVFS